MTRNVVNLDALIPRANLFALADDATADIPGLKVTDLAPGVLYSWMRKPDFQRETANWSPEQVADLIITFATGNIIPAIILWQSGARIYVIDGAHRLSALIAWVQDDYGAGKLSAALYENVIPAHQKAMHDTTKKLVQDAVGSYYENTMAAQFPNSANAEMAERSSKLHFRSIEVQWIRTATVDQASKAFFRINRGGTAIDETETRILLAKNSALAVSSRAISRGGAGHEYWKAFGPTNRAATAELGSAIHKLLFTPPLSMPIKTLEVPLAAFGYGSHVLAFAFDLIGLTNKLPVPDSTRKRVKAPTQVDDDLDGTQTVSYLNRAKRAVQLVCSDEIFSLGLHPALYFYNLGGTFQPAAFFNTMAWVLDLEEKKKIMFFLEHRGAFEELIQQHPAIVKPAAHKLGSGVRTRSRTVALFTKILSLLSEGKNLDEVWSALIADDEFKFLASDDLEQKEKGRAGTPGRRFSRGGKSAGYFATAFPTAPKCALCGGLLHVNGISGDHNDKRADGGGSESENYQPTHPACNADKDKMGK